MFDGTGSVAWQIHDHEAEEDAKRDRWFKRMFSSLRDFVELCERRAKRNGIQ